MSREESIRIAAWRKMSADEKYNLFRVLMRSVRELKKAGIRLAHPDWTEDQVKRETARIFLHART
jgi:predicted Fe-S protein YdhL (DUF1289 family)